MSKIIFLTDSPEVVREFMSDSILDVDHNYENTIKEKGVYVCINLSNVYGYKIVCSENCKQQCFIESCAYTETCKELYFLYKRKQKLERITNEF